MSELNQLYVPCLRWKMGEYQAVMRLSSAARNSIIPLIEMPERSYDFEIQAYSKSLDDHFSPFADRVIKKWGKNLCFVDLLHVEQYVSTQAEKHQIGKMYQELISDGCEVVPVTGINRARIFQDAIQNVVEDFDTQFCLRLTIDEAILPATASTVNALLATLGGAGNGHLILDLRSPNYEPVAGFAKAIEGIIRAFPALDDWITFTLLGTSFPETMGTIKHKLESVPRNEWLLYKELASNLADSGIRIPNFGDYSINHPDLLPMDMRMLKPSATIRYAAEDSWLIVKGKNVRDNKFGQYRDHCNTLQTTGVFSGKGFCAGDKYIYDCAAGVESTGNLSTWRWVGTNHHIEFVVAQFSKFFSP